MESVMKKVCCRSDKLLIIIVKINFTNQPDIEPDLGEKKSKSWKPAKQDLVDTE